MSDTVSFAELEQGSARSCCQPVPSCRCSAPATAAAPATAEGAHRDFGMTILGVPIPPGAGNSLRLEDGASANGDRASGASRVAGSGRQTLLLGRDGQRRRPYGVQLQQTAVAHGNSCVRLPDAVITHG